MSDDFLTSKILHRWKAGAVCIVGVVFACLAGGLCACLSIVVPAELLGYKVNGQFWFLVGTIVGGPYLVGQAAEAGAFDDISGFKARR